MKGLPPRLYRLTVLVAIVWLVHANHQWHRAQRGSAISLEEITRFFPDAAELGPREPPYMLQAVSDNNGERLGLVLHTSPEADHIRGYSGPTDVIVAMDPTGRVTGAGILSSEDTRDHVEEVIRDTDFWDAFEGLALGAPGLPGIDAVSGSTLTSGAIVRAVIDRLGGVSESSLFPTGILLVEVQQFLPDAAAMAPHPGWPHVQVVANAEGRTIAHALRTAPSQDSLIGYQGPTDTLIVLDADARTIAGLRFRKSLDNDDYYERILEDDDYLKLYDGMAVEDVAGIDFREAGIEGVSGATLTSWAIAESVRRRLVAFTAARDAPPVPTVPERLLTWRHGSLVLVTLGAMVMAFTKWRGRTWIRLAWQVLVVLVLGILTGDLLSQALLAGWARNGVDWSDSVGLLFLAAACLVVPWTTGRQLYCHHLCPHGVLQQWMQKLPVANRSVPGWMHRVLSLLPAALLILVFAAVLFRLRINLAAIEPFDAWLFQVAGWASVSIALAGLAASVFVPLAYCKYGCPTGLLLKFIRSRGTGERFERRDLVAGVLLAAAVVAYILR